MNIDFQTPGSWYDLNEAVTSKLGLNSAEARIYHGVNHALSEITQGLVRQFPHKKKVFYFRYMDPFLEPHMVALAREGYSVTRLDLKEIEQPDSFIDKIDREALFVAYSEDDPLIGRSYPITSMEQALAESKAFRIRVSHAAHCYSTQPQDLDRHEIRVHSIHPQLCLGLLGSRARFGSLVAEGLSWDMSLLEELKGLMQAKSTFEARVKEFEQGRPGQSEIFFSDANRLWDRAVLYWPDMDGLALIHYLSKELGFELKAPGFEPRLETTSLSRWGGVKTMDWLTAQGLSPEQIRGLVMISADLINDELITKIKKVRGQVLQLQTG